MTKNQKTVYTVTNPNAKSFNLSLKGRNKWALDELSKAGENGCTPINNPAPRWSAYVHNLRGFGVMIKTVTEQHGGAFAGNHARYVLIADVAVIIGGVVL